MIFVIMGMEVHPFDRLARAVDELARAGDLGEDFFVQLGTCSYEPRHARFERFLSFGDVCEQVQRASVTITHAGAGSTLLCIEQGKCPVMVPRRSSYGEHVDEHQLPFAAKLEADGSAIVVREMTELSAAIAAARSRSAPGGALDRARELTEWLQAYWQGLSRDRGGGRRSAGPRHR